VAHSGLITTPSWTDGALEAGKEYVFVITALYFDGRQGSTQVIAATPMPTLPAVRLPKDADLLTAAETILRFTACGQKSGGPGPATITPDIGTPAGARFRWAIVPSAANYVVDRAPYGTTTWTLVGSTCGGPSPLYAGTDYISIRDVAPGVTPFSRYTYRVTAVGSNGAAGWLTYHFTAPCRYISTPLTTVSGSTVTVKWSNGSSCSSEPSIGPDNYTLSTSFGYTKAFTGIGGLQDIIYGVPVGTHTITVVGNYRTGGTTRPGTATITVAY